MQIIDSEVANDPHSTANAAVPAGFAGLLPAERFISNLEINRAQANEAASSITAFPVVSAVDSRFSLSGDHFVSSWPVAYLIATMVLGVGLTVAAITHVSEPIQLSNNSNAVLEPNAHTLIPNPSATVGRVTSMVDCTWGRTTEDKGRESAGLRSPAREKVAGGDRLWHLQSAIQIGDTFVLRSGLLEITYDTGAKVILQAPVTYEVESAAGGYLSIGKLTAKLEKRSSPVSRPQSPVPLFAVRTPTAVVTDLGTEFGVEVDGMGTTTSYVFRGSVQVQKLVNATPFGPSQVLVANESAQINDSKQTIVVSTGDGKPNHFVQNIPKQDNGGLRVLAHFRLGETDPEAADGKPGNETTFGGIGRVKAQRRGTPHYTSDVRAPNSTIAMEFDANEKQCYFVPYVLTAETDNMGIEAWVKPADANREGAIAWNGDMGWGLLQRGGVLCCHLNTIGDIGMFKFTPGQWYHVAMIRDDGVTTFYVDGKPLATDRGEATIPWGRFWIGCTEEKYYFSGAIDEVRVFEFTRGQFRPQYMLIDEAKGHVVAPKQVPDGIEKDSGGFR
jgi:hypothetical protein